METKAGYRVITHKDIEIFTAATSYEVTDAGLLNLYVSVTSSKGQEQRLIATFAPGAWKAIWLEALG